MRPSGIVSGPVTEGRIRLAGRNVAAGRMTAGGTFSLATMVRNLIYSICARRLLTRSLKYRALMHKNDMPAGSGDRKLKRRQLKTLASQGDKAKIVEKSHFMNLIQQMSAKVW